MAFHESFDSTVQKSQAWLKELNEQAGLANEHQAMLVLRAVLHALRDRLTVQEAVDVAAQLPMLIRGLYYDGWKPVGKPVKERHKDQFLDHIRSYFPATPDIDAEYIARSVFIFLSRHITSGEIQDIEQMLPPEIRALWPAEAAASK